MPIDSTPQPCPRCLRSTVLISYPTGRQWVHLGTWHPHCETTDKTLDASDRFRNLSSPLLRRAA